MSYIGGNTNPGNYIGNHPVAGYASSLPNFRNKIINGDMRIDQRNAGGSVVWSTSNYFPVDRWKAYAQSGSGHTAQQSTDVPSGSGFNNSVKLTVGTGASPASNVLNIFYQVIEGYQIADLMFGSVNAKSVTLSFWVKSSGLPSYPATFSVGLQDSVIGTGIPKEYIINSSDTWEYKTLTFIGDVNTGSTYSKINGVGLYLTFDLGSGSNHEGSANVWSSGNIKRTSSSVKLIETSGATFYITGVQLEEGTVTPFEHRPYGLELSLSQRYYFKTFNQATAPAQGVNSEGSLSGSSAVSNISFTSTMKLPVSMRTKPNPITTYSTTNSNSNWSDQSGLQPTATVLFAGENSIPVRATTSIAAGGAHSIHITAEAEL